MKRYKCEISYDGTLFAGYQVQPNKRTVQGEMEKALKKLHKGQDIKVNASGRTDAGVHAKGQVIHFDSNLNIPLNKWGIALNTLLPDDVAVIEVHEATVDFHARFDAKGKEYRYFVRRSKGIDPFQRNYSFTYSYPLEIAAMKEAASLLIGRHDFTSFSGSKSVVEDKVRVLKKIELIEDKDLLIIRFVGNGFLYNMVRILTGTLLAVGNGSIYPKSMPEILDKKDRSLAGKTAPAHGLYLWEVFY